MNDNRLVTKEGRAAWIGGEERVYVVSHKWAGCDLAIFAREVADLAAGEVCGVTWVVFTTIGGIEMAHGRRAIAIGRYSKFMDVVEEGTEFGRAGEAGEVGNHTDARDAWLGRNRNGAIHGGARAIID